VKLRRGETARVFDELRTMADVHAWFGRYLRLLRRKALSVASHDPTAKVGPSGGRASQPYVSGCWSLLCCVF
jgi:hypothetical protein